MVGFEFWTVFVLINRLLLIIVYIYCCGWLIIQYRGACRNYCVQCNRFEIMFAHLVWVQILNRHRPSIFTSHANSNEHCITLTNIYFWADILFSFQKLLKNSSKLNVEWIGWMNWIGCLSTLDNLGYYERPTFVWNIFKKNSKLFP